MALTAKPLTTDSLAAPASGPVTGERLHQRVAQDPGSFLVVVEDLEESLVMLVAQCLHLLCRRPTLSLGPLVESVDCGDLFVRQLESRDHRSAFRLPTIF